MKMKMENDLTCIRTIVHHQPESLVTNAELICYELDRLEQIRHYVRRSVQQVSVVLFRTDKQVGEDGRGKRSPGRLHRKRQQALLYGLCHKIRSSCRYLPAIYPGDSLHIQYRYDWSFGKSKQTKPCDRFSVSSFFSKKVQNSVDKRLGTYFLVNRFTFRKCITFVEGIAYIYRPGKRATNETVDI